MNTLTAQEVKQKMTLETDIILVMVLGDAAFKKAHIPKSLNIPNVETAKQHLPIEAKIIVYCSDNSCTASLVAYQKLESAGYQNIWRFVGGLREWDDAGYALDSSD